MYMYHLFIQSCCLQFATSIRIVNEAFEDTFEAMRVPRDRSKPQAEPSKFFAAISWQQLTYVHQHIRKSKKTVAHRDSNSNKSTFDRIPTNSRA